MKGVILHGGFGTKLRPLTHTGPKQLIPIANKPNSQYVLEDLKASGITQIAIVLGARVLLILLPVTISLRLIGWTLLWTGSKTKPQKPKPNPQTNTTITTTILLENEEYNA